MVEGSINGNIKNNLKMICAVHVLETRRLSESKDYYPTRNIWHGLQFTQIIHCAVLEKHRP